CYQFYSGYTF
nr:immunoglobulin light chain junction region [Macaca mulatta]MOW40364.1 immunoglobulin light chain junction region [Macaca mulatta]